MDSSRIKQARKAAKMTQAQLADVVGVNRATISKYESGEIIPSIEMLGYISDAVGCTIEYLLGYDNEMRPSIETKALIAAIRRKDPRVIEKLTGLEPGTIGDFPPSPPEYRITFNTTLDPEFAKLEEKLKNDTITPCELRQYKELLVQGIDNAHKAIPAAKDCILGYMNALNEEGQQKAIERVQELTEIPRYQRTPQQEKTHTEPSEGQSGHSDN